MPQIFHLSYAILFFISAGANKITGIGKEKISPWHGAGPQEQVLPEQPCDAFNLFQQKTRLKEIVTRIVAPGDPVPSPAWRLYKNTCASPPLLKRMEKAKDKPRIMKTKEFSSVVFLLFPNSFVAVGKITWRWKKRFAPWVVLGHPANLVFLSERHFIFFLLH